MALAGAFFAAVLVAVALAALAGAFLAAVFFAGAAVAELRRTAGPEEGSLAEPEITALNCAPGRNAGTEVGLTLTVSPVRGLRATRAARLRCSKTPKPVMVTDSPEWTARTIVSTIASTAAPAVRRSVPSFSVSASISSALFMDDLPLWSEAHR